MERIRPLCPAGRTVFEVILDCEEGYYLADSEALDAFVNGKKARSLEAADNGVAITIEYSDTVLLRLASPGGELRGRQQSGILFAEGEYELFYKLCRQWKSGGKYTAVYEFPKCFLHSNYTVKVSKKDHVTGECEVT